MATRTTTNGSALHYGIGSKAGYAAGYWYLVYSDGTNIRYVSTADPTCDPSSFGSETVIKAGSNGSYAQALFDDIYCYMASCTPDSNPIKIRRGLCSGGSISWETEATAATGTQMRVTSMDIMEDGSILIGYYDTNKAKVTRLTNTNGSWSVASGYPMTVSDSGEDSVNHYVKVLALTGSKWYVLYCGVTGGHIYGKLWNGSSLSSREQCTDVIASATPRWDARAVGDNVFLAWNGQLSMFNLYRRVRSSGTWGTTATMATMGGSDYDKVPAVSVNKDTGDVFVAWQGYSNAVHVYYQKYTALTSSWGSTVDAVTESALPNKYQIVGLNRAQNDSVLFFYLSGSSPYTLDNIHIESLTASAGGVGPSGGVAYGGIMII